MAQDELPAPKQSATLEPAQHLRLPSLRAASRILFGGAVLFAVLMVCFPILGRAYTPVFRGGIEVVGKMVLDDSLGGVKAIPVSKHHAPDTRISVIRSRFRDPKTGNPMTASYYAEVGSYHHGYMPFAVFLSLLLVTRVPWHRKLRPFLLGTLFVHVFVALRILMAIYFAHVTANVNGKSFADQMSPTMVFLIEANQNPYQISGQLDQRRSFDRFRDFDSDLGHAVLYETDDRAGSGRTGRNAMSTAESAARNQSRNRVMRRFILTFLGLFLVFEVLIYTVLVKSGIYDAHLNWNAKVSGGILAWFFDDMRVVANHIQSSAYSITVAIGCDAIQPAAVYLAGVLSFPVPAKKKLVGALVGGLILQAVNLVRITSLFALGLYHPDLFELAHVEIWQGLFIVLALVLWSLWVRWADPRPVPRVPPVQPAQPV